MRSHSPTLLVVATVAAILGPALSIALRAQQTKSITDKALRKPSATEWLSYGRDDAETHYSPLMQISTANVERLQPAWTFDLGTAGPLEATPLVSGGVMYLTGPWSTVFAIDARTGKEKWRWDPQLPRTGGVRLCCGPVNRGVALYRDKVFVGLLDGRLVALNAATGATAWQAHTSVDPEESYSITGAPRVVKGKVIIGNGGAENAVRGYVSAYDADTGKLAWRFFTVPGDPSKPFENPELEAAAKTWTGEWWKYGGGGTVWDGMAYDAEADLLYVGTGNGGPWVREYRSPQGGDNLYLASILAVRPDTGRLVWHFQQNPGEQWDYTATQPIILADLRIDGRTRKVLMQAPKNGFFYVLDRLTGSFISGKPFVRTTWAKELDAKTGRPIEAPGIRYGLDPVVLAPGPPGAHNWHPMAYHPGSGLVFFAGRVNSYPYRRDPKYEYKKGNGNLGIVISSPAEPVPGEPPPGGFMIAWDPVAQQARWRIEYEGGAVAGTLATAGDLVFQAAPNGMLVAYDVRAGKKLWQGAVGAGAATPVSYELDGRQFVAILGGRGGPNGDPSRLTAFALGAAATR